MGSGCLLGCVVTLLLASAEVPLELQVVLDWDGRSPALISFDEIARRCEAALAKGDHAEAVRFELWLRLTSVRFHQRNQEAARKAVTEALKLRPDHPEALFRLGQLLLRESGNVDEVQRIAGRLSREHPRLPFGPFLAGCHALEQERPTDAIAHYTKALELAPRFSPALYRRAFTHYELKQYERCVTDLKTLMALPPSAEDESPQILLLFAHALYHLDRVDEAAPVLAHLHQRNPESWDVNSFLWLCYVKLGQFGNALALTERLQQLHPKNERTHWMRARSLAQAGQLEPAKQHARYAVQLGQQSQAAWTSLGVVLHRQGKLQEGLDAFQNALRLGSPHPDTILRAAFIFATAPDEAMRKPALARDLSNSCLKLLTPAQHRCQALLVLAIAETDLGNARAADEALKEAGKLAAAHPRLRASCVRLAESLPRQPYRVDPAATTAPAFLLDAAVLIDNHD